MRNLYGRLAMAMTLGGATAWGAAMATVGDTFAFPLHNYNMTVTAPADQDVIGVIMVQAFSIFALDAAAPIQAPTMWDYVPPTGPGAEDLFFFSTDSSANITKDTSLSGFLFATPNDFKPFKVDLVLINGDLVEVTATSPEPSTSWVAAAAIAGALAYRRYKRTA